MKTSIKIFEKQELNFSRSTLFNMKTRVSLKSFVNYCRCFFLSRCFFCMSFLFLIFFLAENWCKNQLKLSQIAKISFLWNLSFILFHILKILTNKKNCLQFFVCSLSKMSLTCENQTCYQRCYCKTFLLSLFSLVVKQALVLLLPAPVEILTLIFCLS